MALRDHLAGAGVRGPSVVAVGTFDGVHLGHSQLLGEVVRRARVRGAAAVAITFYPRPAEILRPGPPLPYLCSIDERVRLLRSAGLDAVIVVPFDQSLSEMSAEDFCGQLVTGMTMVELVGGPDLALGHGRSGTPEVLRSIGERHGFELTIVPAFELGGVAVRTRVARQALEAGDVNRVAHLLGRPFSVTGPVVHGQGRGRTIGVPTANVAVAANLAMPANGVYAVRVWVGDHQWGGAANLGVRPTFGEQSRSLEIHLLDFTGDLYGQVCRVEFLERLRAEQRFSSVSELISQIQRDIVEARQVLSQQSPHR